MICSVYGCDGATEAGFSQVGMSWLHGFKVKGGLASPSYTTQGEGP